MVILINNYLKIKINLNKYKIILRINRKRKRIYWKLDKNKNKRIFQYKLVNN